MILDALLWGAGIWAVLAAIALLIGMIRAASERDGKHDS